MVNKVAGLTDTQAFTAAVSPSTLTPATVVKHLTGTERFWFSIDFADLDVAWPWTDDDLHSNFRIEPGDTLATVWPTTSRSARRGAINRVGPGVHGTGQGHDVEGSSLQTHTHDLTFTDAGVHKRFVSGEAGEADREWQGLTVLAEHAPGLARNRSAARRPRGDPSS